MMKVEISLIVGSALLLLTENIWNNLLVIKNGLIQQNSCLYQLEIILLT